MDDQLLSSAEMTAYWRSQEPEISGDTLSAKLVSPSGIQLAKQFENDVYPNVTRHLTIRNRYFQSRILKLLSTHQYDSCFSLGSGLSLLTYYLALQTTSKIRFYDFDIPEMIEFREERIKSLNGELQSRAMHKISTIGLDIEQASNQDQNFCEIMPKVNSPIIIMEGITYFLSSESIKWIFDSIEQYKTIAFVFDYWPDYAANVSDVFNRAFKFIKNSVKENIKLQLSRNDILELIGPYKLHEDMEVREVETEFVDSTLMGDMNNIFPARFAVVVSNKR